LLSPLAFRDLVSGRRQGVAAAVLRGGLRLAEVFYAGAVRWRNRRYQSGAAAVHRMNVPVVSVGNLTLGGTGKTPMVEWLARWFRARGVRVAIVSRGYGAAAGTQNDEALELARKLPDVPHVQNADRAAAARKLIAEFQSQVILLDDGFQHRRIGRDLDIVLLDALEPFGFGHVFPRGTLREPIDGLRRADVVALSRADMLDAGQREDIWQTVLRYAPQAIRAEVVHAPRMLLAASGLLKKGTGSEPTSENHAKNDGSEVPVPLFQPLERIRPLAVAAFCGLGNPAGFRHTLETCGCRLAAFREFPDHHRYTRADVQSLAAWAKGLDVSAVLCTEKDLVKLSVDQLGGRPLWALGVGLEFLAGQQAVEAELAKFVGR